MAGIYIHIPFCKQACSYCDFYFSTSNKMTEPLVEAIVKEIELQKEFFEKCENPVIQTIYFGGGTPSLIAIALIQKIVDTITQYFDVDRNAEITIEVNPDDCSVQKIKEWKKSGVNRISCGVQSFYDADLQFMNRSHTASQAESAIKRIQDSGIENITLDLIYGIPEMKIEQWQANLQKVIALEVPHLSCYSLTVEEKTALAHWVKNKKVKIDEQEAALHFEYLMDWCSLNHFEHYEISNMCKPGFQSKHNTAYWQGVPYLGLGPAAHSYNGHCRQFNVPNMFTYMKAVTCNLPFVTYEELSFREKYHEKIMTALRLGKGIALKEMTAYFDPSIETHFKTTLNKYQLSGHIQMQDNHFFLTRSGKLLADYIIQDFFIV